MQFPIKMKELREAPKQAHLTMKNVSRMINTFERMEINWSNHGIFKL